VDDTKAYEDLTRRGRLRRIQSVARTALNTFGFTEANLRLVVDAGNVLYRVKAVDPAHVKGSLYVENSYLLRLTRTPMFDELLERNGLEEIA
jgi:hypothetical protein